LETSINKLSKKINDLPTPDFIVQRIINVASDPESSTKDLNMAVLQSPTLSAKILKLSNSAYYALPRKITKLSQAINILGFKTVRNLALGVFTANSYFKKEYEFFNTEKFWKHLMSTAMASELLCKYLNYPDKEEAFLSGMLHDMGKIVMAYVMPDIFEIILKVARHKKIKFHQAEDLLNTYSHQIVGKMLFENWGLSELIINTAAYHDTPSEAKDSDSKMMIGIVSIANLSVNTIMYGYSGNFGIEIPDDKTWNNIGLTPKLYLNYFKELEEKINKSNDFMNLKDIIVDMDGE
jgi:HD-like signal output (HDOD) protein